MAIDDVEDINPKRQYTASAAQTAFDYPFPIFEDSDIVADVDGTTKVLTTDYTVSGEGNDTGGTVTFIVPMSGGEIVTIYRDVPIERISQFANDGPLSSDTFNEELNRVTMVQQQLAERIARCIRQPIIGTVADADLELDMSAFAGKYMAFDADGVPTPAAGTSSVTSGTIPGLSQDGALTLIYAPVSGTVFSVDINGMLTCGGVNVTASGIPSAGIYRPTANTLGLSSNGVKRITLGSTGSVVIAAPDTPGVVPLVVTANGVGAGLNLTDGTRTASILTVSGGYRFLATSAHSLALGANNAVAQTFSATGEVVFAAGVSTTTVNLGSSGTAIAVNCRLSNVFRVQMTGNVSSGNFTLTNPSDGQTINIKITQDGTGSRTLGFGASILWPGGVDGVLSTAAGAVDYLVMTYHADTTSWHASLTQAFA